MFVNDTLAVREQWLTQNSENAARGAWAWGTVTSTGWGELVIPDPILFEITFTDVPTVGYGFSMVDDNQLVDGRFPRCSGGVASWVQDVNDFYVGAHVFITVATADPLLAAQSLDVAVDFADDPAYDLTHSFMFTGLAMKDVVNG